LFQVSFKYLACCGIVACGGVLVMASHGDIVEILARFPGPVTLYSSRKKWLLIFGISAAFVVVGYWMIQDDEWMGWPGLIFFGLGALVAAAMLLPGAGALSLDREGFEATTLFRRHRTRWRNASSFDVWEMKPPQVWSPKSLQKLLPKNVVFDDSEPKSGRMAAANIAICGHTSGLPDTYGLSAEALAQLMTQWRERALR
jgi:hypothetical protein